MDTCVCISGHYFSPESVPRGSLHTCESRLVAEEGVNMCPGKAAENCKNTGTDVVLKGVSAAGTNADGFA
jgi:hypothetical protein